MQRVVSPGKRRLTQYWTYQQTHEHTQQGRQQTPSSHHFHEMLQRSLITCIIKRREMAHGTERDTQIGSLRHKADGGIEE